MERIPKHQQSWRRRDGKFHQCEAPQARFDCESSGYEAVELASINTGKGIDTEQKVEFEPEGVEHEQLERTPVDGYEAT